MDEIWYALEKRDVLNHLLAREEKVPVYRKQSPQLEHRPRLVSWMGFVCTHFSLQTVTKHLAIALMDLFMDDFLIGEDQLQLVALSSMTIAAKFEEKEVDIPRAKEMLALIGNIYSIKLCMYMEMKILDELKWMISFPTVAHFCDLHEEIIVSATDELAGKSLNTPAIANRAKLMCLAYVPHLLDMVLDVKYRKYKPSTVCCIIFAAARKLSEISPVWSSQLEREMGYPFEEIMGPFAELTSDYKRSPLDPQQFHVVPPDCDNSPSHSVVSASSGYVTDSPSNPPDAHRAGWSPTDHRVWPDRTPLPGRRQPAELLSREDASRCS